MCKVNAISHGQSPMGLLCLILMLMSVLLFFAGGCTVTRKCSSVNPRYRTLNKVIINGNHLFEGSRVGLVSDSIRTYISCVSDTKNKDGLAWTPEGVTIRPGFSPRMIVLYSDEVSTDSVVAIVSRHRAVVLYTQNQIGDTILVDCYLNDIVSNRYTPIPDLHYSLSSINATPLVVMVEHLLPLYGIVAKAASSISVLGDVTTDERPWNASGTEDEAFLNALLAHRPPLLNR
ncbi:MAG: hypothetical protein RIR53_71 [Bacteroidota bacterium]